MKKIKSYKDFRPINESLGFGNSDEYDELLKLFARKDKEEIKEYFYELTDDNLVDLRIWSFIGDESGRSIGYSSSSVNLSQSHHIYYSIELESKNLLITNFNDMKIVSNTLSKIEKTIDSFEKNIGESNIQEKDLQGPYKSGIKIKYTIKGEEISKSTMETFYKKWKNNYGPKYDEGIKYLIGEYQHRGIQNPPLDTNDTGDHVDIGFFTDDEIIAVAGYTKSTDEFKIFDNEIRRSIKEYRIEQNQ